MSEDVSQIIAQAVARAPAWTRKELASNDVGQRARAEDAMTDCDSIRCGSKQIRLVGIDASEMPGPCREGRDCTPGDPFASKANLAKIIGWFPDVRCKQTDIDGCGRIVAQCTADAVDLSCRQIVDGQAVYRYASISC